MLWIVFEMANPKLKEKYVGMTNSVLDQQALKEGAVIPQLKHWSWQDHQVSIQIIDSFDNLPEAQRFTQAYLKNAEIPGWKMVG